MPQLVTTGINGHGHLMKILKKECQSQHEITSEKCSGTCESFETNITPAILVTSSQ